MNQSHAPLAAEQDPLSDEYVNAVIRQHGYGHPTAVAARLWQWIGRHGGENGLTLLIYEAHKALSKLRAEGVQAGDERDRDATISEVVGKCNSIPGATTWNAAAFMYDEMDRRAALASAPVADEQCSACNPQVISVEQLEKAPLLVARLWRKPADTDCSLLERILEHVSEYGESMASSSLLSVRTIARRNLEARIESELADAMRSQDESPLREALREIASAWSARTRMPEEYGVQALKDIARAALASAPVVPQPCPTDVCQAAKADGVLCANDECDRANGLRPASAPVAGEAQVRPQRVLTDDERAAVEFYSLNPSAAVRDLDKRLAGHAAPQASEAVRLLRKIREDDFLSDTQRHRIDRLLASAPVAGEAITDEMIQAGAKAAREYFERTGGNDPAVIYRAMHAIAPAAPQASEGVRILFPAHLRKMWSGGEVQAWLDEHQGITAPKASVKGSLERYRKWQAEQPQAGKASAPCSCPSGGGSLRWPCAVHPPRGRPTQPSKDGGGDE